MSFIPLNRNTLALIAVLLLTSGFFIAGLFDVLDYFIIKVLLFAGAGTLLGIAFWYAHKNDNKKNRPEENPQDDSY